MNATTFLRSSLTPTLTSRLSLCSVSDGMRFCPVMPDRFRRDAQRLGQSVDDIDIIALRFQVGARRRERREILEDADLDDASLGDVVEFVGLGKSGCGELQSERQDAMTGQFAGSLHSHEFLRIVIARMIAPPFQKFPKQDPSGKGRATRRQLFLDLADECQFTQIRVRCVPFSYRSSSFTHNAHKRSAAVRAADDLAALAL